MAISAIPVFAADFAGTIVVLIDGDTIEVLHTNKAERIRLQGIDCPEKGQAHGQKAKQAASALVFGKEVTRQAHGQGQVRTHRCQVLLVSAPVVSCAVGLSSLAGSA